MDNSFGVVKNTVGYYSVYSMMVITVYSIVDNSVGFYSV